MNAGSIEEFDGISLVEWTDDNKIKSLKEFGCNRNAIIRINMAINLDLEMKRQIGFDMLIIVVDFRHEFNKGNMETEKME